MNNYLLSNDDENLDGHFGYNDESSYYAPAGVNGDDDSMFENILSLEQMNELRSMASQRDSEMEPFTTKQSVHSQKLATKNPKKSQPKKNKP